MKNKTFILLALLLVSFISVNGQSKTKKSNPVGTWKFEAPYAPEGYTSGMIVVGMAEKKHTATMSFTGNDYNLPGENVKNVNDSLYFSIFLEGQDIQVLLKIENENKMSGKAVYSEGEVPLTLTKTESID